MFRPGEKKMTYTESGNDFNNNNIFITRDEDSGIIENTTLNNRRLFMYA